MPADAVAILTLELTSGTTRSPIYRREASFLAAYSPDSSVTGAPKYWAQRNATTIMLAPPSSGSYGVDLQYIGRPATLSATNTSTWLSTFFPDLMTYAALVYASGFQRNFGQNADDKGQPAGWEALYQGQLPLARNEISQGKTPGVFDHSPAPGSTGGEAA
jgi:hypothetical protein